MGCAPFRVNSATKLEFPDWLETCPRPPQNVISRTSSTHRHQVLPIVLPLYLWFITKSLPRNQSAVMCQCKGPQTHPPQVTPKLQRPPLSLHFLTFVCGWGKALAHDGARGPRLPPAREWWKTGVAFLYATFNLVFTTVVITVVHERVPDKTVNPPLPDKFFDYIDRVPWAFTVTEWLFLKHKYLPLRIKAIIGRRCFFLIGTLYMYRCITMYITTLPVPGKHMVCLYNDSTGKIWRILQLISGGGLSLTGSHLMCGDFLYSGHTVMLTLSYLFIKEYCPRWMWWYHWSCWVLSVSGVVCILVAHEHYSIDVVIAYFVTTRLFWWYHTMANSHALRRAPNNLLSRTWWNPVFNFLERNVQTVVPVEFRYKMVEAGRDE
uniref:Sphingomyelin synthase 2b n=1 Tax=Neogobius melanostomus TaxID=47308 RepID=A0A8C6SUB7_9GOBI